MIAGMLSYSATASVSFTKIYFWNSIDVENNDLKRRSVNTELKRLKV